MRRHTRGIIIVGSLDERDSSWSVRAMFGNPGKSEARDLPIARSFHVETLSFVSWMGWPCRGVQNHGCGITFEAGGNAPRALNRRRSSRSNANGTQGAVRTPGWEMVLCITCQIFLKQGNRYAIRCLRMSPGRQTGGTLADATYTLFAEQFDSELLPAGQVA